MKFSDLGDNGPDFIREMDSQGYTGSRDGSDPDAGKKEYYGKVAKPKDVVKQGIRALDNAFNHKEDDWSAEFERRMKNEKGVGESSDYERSIPPGANEGRVKWKCPACGVASGIAAFRTNDYKCPNCGEPLPAKNQLGLKHQQVKQIADENLSEDANFMPAGNHQGYPIEVRKTKFNDKYFIAQTVRPIGKEILKDWGATQDEALQKLKDAIDGIVAKSQAYKKNVTTVGFGAPFAQGVLRKGDQKFYVKFADGKVLVSDTPEQGFRPVAKNSPQAISPSGSFKVDEIKGAGFDISTRYELVPTDNENEFEAKKHSLITSSNDKYVMPFPGMAIQHPDRNGVSEASLAQMRDYFNQTDTDSVKVDRNNNPPVRKTNPLGIPPEIQALVNKMYHAGKISPQEFEVLRKFQQKTKINVGIREADKNPYAIGMAQAMKSTGDKPPLKKSTINKAHEIARAIKKGE